MNKKRYAALVEVTGIEAGAMNVDSLIKRHKNPDSHDFAYAISELKTAKERLRMAMKLLET